MKTGSRLPNIGMDTEELEHAIEVLTGQGFSDQSNPVNQIADVLSSRAAEYLAEEYLIPSNKRVFDLVKDFGTSQSPKSTRPSTTY